MAVLPLRSLSFVCCLLIIANFISQASADYAQNFTYFCDPSNRGNYTAESNYDATDLVQFNKSLNTLLGNLKSEAASGDSRLKYAVGNISGPHNKVIYGLVQCTPDLLQSECAQCLKLSIESIPRDCCKDKIGGRAVRPSCNMRFETASLFYGDTAYAASPSPSPSRSQSLLPPSSTVTHNTSSGGTCHIMLRFSLPTNNKWILNIFFQLWRV